jgi:hypothetical protein
VGGRNPPFLPWACNPSCPCVTRGLVGLHGWTVRYSHSVRGCGWLPDFSAEQPRDESRTARTRCSPRWQSWQDRYLTQAVDQTRPFLLPSSERKEGWNRTADVLLRDSSTVGARSTVDRTGLACKNRFMKLMKERKVCRSPVSSILAYILLQKGETESRMKTGAVEEVSEHIKVCS